MILNSIPPSVKEDTVLTPSNETQEKPAPPENNRAVNGNATLTDLAQPEASNSVMPVTELTYIHLNDDQMLVNKTAKVFRNSMRIVSMMYFISVASLFLFYLHIGFDLHVFKGRTPHIFGFLCVFFIYTSVATNNFITYLSVGNGKFNKELLVIANHQSTLEDCCGLMNVLKTFGHAGMVSGAVILMMCAAYVSFLNSLAERSTLLSLIFIVGFLVFGFVPVIIHAINYRLSAKHYRALKQKQAPTPDI